MLPLLMKRLLHRMTYNFLQKHFFSYLCFKSIKFESRNSVFYMFISIYFARNDLQILLLFFIKFFKRKCIILLLYIEFLGFALS